MSRHRGTDNKPLEWTGCHRFPACDLKSLPATQGQRWAAAVLAFCRDQLELGPSQQASKLKLPSSSQTWLVLLEVLERFEQILAAVMALEEKLSEG